MVSVHQLLMVTVAHVMPIIQEQIVILDCKLIIARLALVKMVSVYLILEVLCVSVIQGTQVYYVMLKSTFVRHCLVLREDVFHILTPINAVVLVDILDSTVRIDSKTHVDQIHAGIKELVLELPKILLNVLVRLDFQVELVRLKIHHAGQIHAKMEEDALTLTVEPFVDVMHYYIMVQDVNSVFSKP
jgi:hypothetical protein